MRRLRRPRGVGTVGVVVGAALLLFATALPAYAAVPSVLSVWPNNAAVGCPVTITGANFLVNGGPVTGVTFGAGTAATAFTIDSDTQLQATIAPGTAVGAGNVVVSSAPATGGGTSVAFPYTTTAAAACPTITSFSPGSGGAGTVVTIAGNFITPPTTVRFGTSALVVPTSSTALSVTAVVPAGATTGPVRVYTTSGAASSAASFIVTTTTVPTISSFTPTSGPVGTSVTINGTNLTGATSVTFNNVAAATGWVVNAAGTQITGAIVPATATDGPIRVTTPAGTAVSLTNFDVTGAGGAEHARTVSLQLSGGIKVTGTVVATDGFTNCEANVGVKIQRQKSGGWNTLTTLQTNKSGSYKGYVPKKAGKYRAKAPKVTLLNGAVCGGDTSPTRSYKA